MDEGKFLGEAREISFHDYSGAVLTIDMPVQESALFWVDHILLNSTNLL